MNLFQEIKTKTTFSNIQCPHHVDKHNVINTPLSITFGRTLRNNQLKELPSDIFSNSTKLIGL